ncbi:divalent metal cation transporter [Klebsiella sp. GG_Kp154]|uniref:divalent metal cation transporter n=1 Tax=unclassified Klebsiella TaxID=2608929 RepID=UPI0032B5CFD1
MNLVFGIDWKLGALIMIAVMIYCYFSKGVYSKVEKGITICIVAMIIAFYITLVGTGGPDWKASGEGLTHWMFPAGSLVTALGFISTNASLTTGIYGTYLGKEKKWKKDDLFNGVMVADTVAHIIGVLLISGAIILVGAIVLFPQGISINTPTQLADLLTPSMGRAAKYSPYWGRVSHLYWGILSVGLCCSIPASINLPRWRVKRSSGDPW